jgi:AcrR family transcriptional regulator
MDLKQKIIDESLRLFSLKGFLSTSIHDILQAAKTSKGGLYNHFQSKEELFLAVLREAQRIWRQKTLVGLDQIESPLEKLKIILRNYRDRYLKDRRHFPGGCIFLTFSVELDDQRPKLSREINKGFNGFKRMIRELLEEGKQRGELRGDINAQSLSEMIFAGMLGASVIYGAEKSAASLDLCINALIDYLDTLTT